jgi:hypothetical protein
MSKHARLKGESIQEWLDRVSIPSSSWFKKAKRRQRYKKFYDMKFYILLKYTMLKSIIIKKLK